MRWALVFTVLLATMAGPAVASAAPIRECGNYGYKNGAVRWTYGEIEGAGIFNVTSRRVWCSVARRVARRAYNTYERGDTVWRWKGWRCKRVKTGYESSDTRCTKRRIHIVRWQAGS